jgi:bifunctional non-homologous end joining protein LigD
VEDHPLEYGTFEGTIPQGQYGGGTVQLWDHGTWTPQSNDPRGDLAKGQLKIILNGERMKGRWALIRLRDDKAKLGRKVRHNWLLIKEKDEVALPGEPDALLAADTSVTTGRTLEEIAASKKSKVWQSSRKKGASFDHADEPPAPRPTVKKKTRPSRVTPNRPRSARKA